MVRMCCRTHWSRPCGARADGDEVDNLEGWLLRIAHHTSLDFLRGKSRNPIVPLTADAEAAPIPEADMVAVGVQDIPAAT